MLSQRFSFFFAGGIKINGLPVDIYIAVTMFDGYGVGVSGEGQGAHGF